MHDAASALRGISLVFLVSSLSDEQKFLSISDSESEEMLTYLNLSPGKATKRNLPSNHVLRELANYMVYDDSMTIAVKRFLAESEEDIRAQRNLDQLNRRLFALCEFHINNFLRQHGSSFDDLIKGLLAKNTHSPKKSVNFGLMLLRVTTTSYENTGKIPGFPPKHNMPWSICVGRGSATV